MCTRYRRVVRWTIVNKDKQERNSPETIDDTRFNPLYRVAQWHWTFLTIAS